MLHVLQVWTAQAGRLPLGENWSLARSSDSHSLETAFFFFNVFVVHWFPRDEIS